MQLALTNTGRCNLANDFRDVQANMLMTSSAKGTKMLGGEGGIL